MKKIVYSVCLIIAFSILSGCSNVKQNQIRKVEYAPKFYSAHPKSILILPAINTTTAADAADHFRYTITQPLAEQGYYVFPVHLVDSFFKSENLPDSELVRDIPVSKLAEIFNADSILYVDILNWDTEFSVIESSVDVGLSFLLVDAESEEEIWRGNVFGRSATQADTGGIVEIIASIIVATVNTGVDYTEVSINTNTIAANNFPYGYYHSKFQQDEDEIMAIPDYYQAAWGPNIEGNIIRLNPQFIKGTSWGQKEIPKGAYKLSHMLKQKNAYHIIDANYFYHSGFEDYYYNVEISGVKNLRHRFFLYENNKPYLIAENNKVFVEVSANGLIEYNFIESSNAFLEDDYYTMNIEKVIPLKAAEE